MTEVYEGAIFSLFLGEVSIGFERFSDAADCLRGHEVVMVVGRSKVRVRNVIRHEGETLKHRIVDPGAFETTVDRVGLGRHFCDTQTVVRKVSVQPRAQVRRHHAFSSRFLQPRPKNQC